MNYDRDYTLEMCHHPDLIHVWKTVLFTHTQNSKSQAVLSQAITLLGIVPKAGNTYTFNPALYRDLCNNSLSAYAINPNNPFDTINVQENEFHAPCDITAQG